MALMVWRLCSCVFDYCTTTRHPFVLRLEGASQRPDSDEAPTGEEGQAWRYLMRRKPVWKPCCRRAGEDFTAFFTLDGPDPDVADGLLYRLFRRWRPDP
ncbi:hypothetical protein MJ585_00560 [Klebsiella pneumoniae]|nr:hypothetical protein MJ585_00560 [Klebsiella pneumoniae]